jgi:nicotinate-nucleotide pyrophosphorylase (carboxylating)
VIDAALSDRALRSLAAQFLAEDVGRGDVTTQACVPPTLAVRARVVARQPLVVAGFAVARSVFLELDERVAFEPQVAEGDRVATATTVALVSGPARAILTGERVALNLLQRLSGIATLTRSYVDRLQGARARIIDTRKTTPGLRMLEKYAVTVGGGHNHRHGLDDGVLIKDNHIAAAGGLRRAIEAARAAVAHSLKVQVEVETLAELREALALGVEAVLLDNMTPVETARAVAIVRAAPGGERIAVESSGGITLESVHRYAEAGVDLISVGALTHSAPAVDLSLEVVTGP